MLKFILGVVIICITTFCGNLFARKYKKRKLFFIQMEEFNARFLTEISYYKRPVVEFIHTVQGEGEYGEVLEHVTQEKSGKKENSYSFLSEYSFLSREERGFIAEYFSALGKGDAASQKAYFHGKGEDLSLIRKRAEEEHKKYGDLYWKLGFLCGLAILILIA